MKKNIIRVTIVAASSLVGAAIGLFVTMPKKKAKEDTEEETIEEKVAATPAVPKEILEAAEKINNFIAPKAEEAVIPVDR